MDIFELAEREILREGKKPTELLIIDYAVKIRKWLDKHGKVAERILAGERYYRYGNKFRTYRIRG